MSLKHSTLGAMTLFTEDLAASKAFYQDVFDLAPVLEDGDSVVFRLGDTLINLLRVSAAPGLIAPVPVAPPLAGSRAQFTIWVDDVDAVLANLQERGVGLISGPLDRAWGQRTILFADPGGHLWEIAQELSRA